MKVVVAQDAGFCWGVRRAMDCALEASTRWGHRAPLRTLGPLIHNPQALEHLAQRGITQAASVEGVAGGTLIIRAHGVPLSDLRILTRLRAQRRLKLINATCPEVARVQAQIKQFSARGCFTVILGQREHPECLAHQSFAESGCAVVATLAEAEALSDDQARHALVIAQTTFSVQDFQAITGFLKGRHAGCTIRNTICADTWTRQDRCRELAGRVQALVVVGGRESNNTRHLAEVGRRSGIPVHPVETAADLDAAALQGFANVGVVAGASTPNWLVDEVVDALEQIGVPPTPRARLLRAVWLCQAPLALGAGVLSLGIRKWMALPFSPAYALMTTAFFLAMHALAPYLDPLLIMAKGPARQNAFRRERWGLVTTGMAALALGLVLAALQGSISFLVLALLSALGLTYARPLRLGSRTFCLRLIPGFKDLGETLALMVLVALLPLVTTSHPGAHRPWSGLLLVGSLGLSRAVIQHIQDFQNDQIQGREVLPRLLGKAWAKAMLLIVSSLALGLCILALARRQSRHPLLTGLVLAAALFSPVFLLWWRHERPQAKVVRRGLGPEICLFIGGVLAFL